MKTKLTAVIMAGTAGLALLGATSGLQATTITVTSTADSGAGSLRAAIASAVSGDIINFAVTGKITLISGELLVNKNLTILGPGPSTLVVDGDQTSRVFHIRPGSNVTIAGLTITRGLEPWASGELWGTSGGILNGSATLTVTNCTVTGNAYVGIENYADIYGSASLTVLNSVISSNLGPWGGMGIINRGWSNGVANVRIINSTVSDNSGCGISNFAESGGAANALIVGSVLYGNSSDWNTVEIDNSSYGATATMKIINSTVSGKGWGGGHWYSKPLPGYGPCQGDHSQQHCGWRPLLWH